MIERKIKLVCDTCHTELDDGSLFCHECGVKLSQELLDQNDIDNGICPQCKQPINSNDKFCKECGYKINKVEASKIDSIILEQEKKQQELDKQYEEIKKKLEVAQDYDSFMVAYVQLKQLNHKNSASLVEQYKSKFIELNEAKQKEQKLNELVEKLDTANEYDVLVPLYNELSNLNYNNSNELVAQYLSKLNKLEAEKTAKIEEQNEKIYSDAKSILDSANTIKAYKSTIKELDKIGEYKDALDLKQKCECAIAKLRKQKNKKILVVLMSVLLIGGGITTYFLTRHDCAKQGHLYGEWIVDTEATCTTSGLQHRECKYCKTHHNRTIEALNHKNYEWVVIKEPQCNKEGQKQKICSDCGVVVETQSISAPGHTYVNGVCSVCGLKENACAKGHKSSEWIIDIEATCTSEGQRHKECTICGQTIKTEKIAKSSHMVGDWIIDKEATCTVDGLKHQHCSVCNQDVNSTTIACTGHTYVNYECTVCHDKLDTTGWSQGLNIQNGVVKGIGACSDINIVIPSYTSDGTKVTSIGNKAFYQCSNLISITIPNSVTSIGQSAFDYCKKLSSITIPNSVTSIGEEAFYGCSSLTSITIPNSVPSIGKKAFYNCSSLTSITIPNSVTRIGYGAFQYCKSLTSITIPNSVTSIEWCAFYGCTSLTSIIVDLNNKKYDSRNNCNAIILTAANTLIAGCKNTTIPNSVTSIGGCAFSGCSNLTSITIPNSVTSIENNAFSGCSSLTSITIPNSVTSIGGSAFSSCSSLTSITIPNSVTSIGGQIFSYCSNLTTITVDSKNKKYDSRNNCNAIIETATNKLIIGCKNTIIPNSVTSIGERAFWGCECLKSITIPNSVTSIGYEAFRYCTSLTSITIPNSVTSIGEWAFCDCKGLTSITIPNSVTSIGEWAFCSIKCNITYQGTIAQWNSISKANDWNNGFDHSIICTDGTINP